MDSKKLTRAIPSAVPSLQPGTGVAEHSGTSRDLIPAARFSTLFAGPKRIY